MSTATAGRPPGVRARLPVVDPATAVARARPHTSVGETVSQTLSMAWRAGAAPSRYPAPSRAITSAPHALRVRDTSTCKLFSPLTGGSSPQTSSISSLAGTGRPPRAASAASSACGRSPATGRWRQRTSPSRLSVKLTRSV
jgi:hypothetical protein